MTFDEWCSKISSDVASHRDVDIRSSDDAVTFSCGQRGIVLRRLSNDTAALVPAVSIGGTIGEGQRLEDRSQWMDARSFSIDDLSAPHVAQAILALLADDV
jgi:hypothetical protein